MVELTHQTLTLLCQPLSQKVGNHLKILQGKIEVHQRYVFTRAKKSTNHLVDRGANGGLAVLI